MSEQQRAHELNIAQEQLRDSVLVTYMNDIGLLLKSNNGSLTSDPVTASIARAKTLTVIQQLDATRSGFVIRFLYEAKQLTSGANSLDISDAELIGIDLSMVHFTKADLQYTSFHNVHSRRTMFRNICLMNATFISSSLQQVVFINCMCQNVNFRSANLKHADFSGAKLKGSTFTQTRLERTNFSRVNLSGMTFYNINLLESTHVVKIAEKLLINRDISKR
ncbi:unnamed protein product [Rotaria sp. Silwood2]|nr:unnamed protein product [Rotaria sp. Silwood2]